MDFSLWFVWLFYGVKMFADCRLKIEFAFARIGVQKLAKKLRDELSLYVLLNDFKNSPACVLNHDFSFHFFLRYLARYCKQHRPQLKRVLHTLKRNTIEK